MGYIGRPNMYVIGSLRDVAVRKIFSESLPVNGKRKIFLRMQLNDAKEKLAYIIH